MNWRVSKEMESVMIITGQLELWKRMSMSGTMNELIDELEKAIERVEMPVGYISINVCLYGVSRREVGE